MPDDVLLDEPPQGADLLPRTSWYIARRRRGLRGLGGQRTLLELPLLAPTVHQAQGTVAVVPEVPVGVGRKPVVVAAIEDDQGVGADTETVHERGEGRGTDEVSPNRILEVVFP